MNRILLAVLFVVLAINVLAQKNIPSATKLFWKEDFSSGKLPDGWINKALNDSSILWDCTNQPFPGSYEIGRAHV